MNKLEVIRLKIRNLVRKEEACVLTDLIALGALNSKIRRKINKRAVNLVKGIREKKSFGMMELFLAEYGLSTEEGVALMCLGESLLRVPDCRTIDQLIEDKISNSSWNEHLGASSSALVNASTWGLMLSGKVLKKRKGDTLTNILGGIVKRLGEPVIRRLTKRAIIEMGHQFVLGQTIKEALMSGKAFRKTGYTFSYDMLGEEALTDVDAALYFDSYSNAINSFAENSKKGDIKSNPGISVKLSALHPRYEVGQNKRVISELIPRVKKLAMLAKNANIGFNIDAEEADRLDLSLDIIEGVFRSPELEGWDGFGIVIQAYGKRAGAVIDWVKVLAEELDRKIMVRLVKGAYWDTEIKVAQVNGIDSFPVFTSKCATDVSYILCAKKLLSSPDVIYSQFATHNAHTVAAILEMAKDNDTFEFQRLYGMGDSLYQAIMKHENIRCRIYAPVGAHRDLLAYLVRRLLENGANSSFVNQISDLSVSAEVIAADPFDELEKNATQKNLAIINPVNLFKPERVNSAGWDLRNIDDLICFNKGREPFFKKTWVAKPLISQKVSIGKGEISLGKGEISFNPANLFEQVGLVQNTELCEVDLALNGAKSWESCKVNRRSNILKQSADLFEENSGEFFALLCRESGKTPIDAVTEIREAVDFLRYYAAQGTLFSNESPRGLICCISPWNFPLAIFTGQIAAALAAGNGVIAKPAEQTPLIASVAVKLMHRAGVPKDVLQFTPGKGSVVGSKLISDPRIRGVCFTGSMAVAQSINRSMAANLEPDTVLIAETGGINAMIIDSTALPEQATKDVIASSFQSAGQRCSALRMLYLQEDIAEEFLHMLYGAMDQLLVGDPWEFSTDIGPVITSTAKAEIVSYIELSNNQGRLLKSLTVPNEGYFVGPSVVKINGIMDIPKEIFGPVLHVAIFKAPEINQIIDDINASGYGLTFGLHTRINDRVEQISSKINVGNMYVNRNQIGAIVGSQPFGGEGLSGTGPKAGGVYYVPRFFRQDLKNNKLEIGKNVKLLEVQEALFKSSKIGIKKLYVNELPGPTGEINRLTAYGMGTILCLGPSADDARSQVMIAKQMGCPYLAVVPVGSGKNIINGFLKRSFLTELKGFDAVVLWSNVKDLKLVKKALAKRNGCIIPLISTTNMKNFCIKERHLCIDTTAAGGNVALLARSS
jgi:RHH-type proline utilization regulon transcriptional repressor/proline dehydrogenase/delta 1-pyrroline-5-carboxylate dehydrogenase